jgi:hypothetical protein
MWHPTAGIAQLMVTCSETANTMGVIKVDKQGFTE